MEVLIVSKTHMANNACVGGIVLNDNRYVRLLNPGNKNQPVDTDLEIGQVWKINFIKRNPLTPPHVEDIIVLNKTFVKDQHDLPKLFTDRKLIDWHRSIHQAFGGLLKWTSNGSGYIDTEGEPPESSVGF